MKKNRYYIILILLLVCLPAIPVSAQVNLITPIKLDTLLSLRTSNITWSGTTEPCDIFYSTDEGKTWINIAAGVTGSSYNWNVPVIKPGHILIRITVSHYEPPKLLWEIPNAHNGEVRSVSISPDSGCVLTSGGDTIVKIWDTSTLQIKNELKTSYTNIYESHFFHNPDSVLFAADNQAVLWDVKSGTIKEFGKDNFISTVRTCAVHPARTIFAAASYDSTINIYDVNSVIPLTTIIPDGIGSIYTVCFSNDGSMLAAAGYNGKIFIYDWQNNKEMQTYTGHGINGQNLLVWSLNFSPADNELASCGVDRTVRTWELSTQQQKYQLDKHASHVRSVKYHPGGNLLLSASLDSTIKQWNMSDGSACQAVINHGGQVLAADYSVTGDSIISGGRDRAVRLWKNFRYWEEADTVRCVLRYPITVSIPHLTASIGERINVPLMLHKDKEIPVPATLHLTAKSIIEIPSKLLNVLTPSQNSLVVYPHETITSDINDFSFRDTVLNLKSLVLSADIFYDTIRVINFYINNDTTYYIEKIDGSIFIQNYCAGNPNGKIVFNKKPLQISVSPNPAADNIRLDLNLIEDGSYKAEVIDRRGAVATKLFEKIFKNGSYSLEYNLKELSEGAYFIRLTAPSETVTQKLVIDR